MNEPIHIIVSSLVLYNKLKELEDEYDYIKFFAIHNEVVTLTTRDGKTALFTCHHKDKSERKISLNTKPISWKSTFKLLKNMEEQPIVMKISEKNIRISVDY